MQDVLGKERVLGAALLHTACNWVWELCRRTRRSSQISKALSSVFHEGDIIKMASGDTECLSFARVWRGIREVLVMGRKKSYAQSCCSVKHCTWSLHVIIVQKNLWSLSLSLMTILGSKPFVISFPCYAHFQEKRPHTFQTQKALLGITFLSYPLWHILVWSTFYVSHWMGIYC